MKAREARAAVRTEEQPVVETAAKVVALAVLEAAMLAAVKVVRHSLVALGVETVARCPIRDQRTPSSSRPKQHHQSPPRRVAHSGTRCHNPQLEGSSSCRGFHWCRTHTQHCINRLS